MVEVIPAPDPQTLIPPLLACLPTSFASARPPPALLELLSPILRQRLQIFTTTGITTNDSWLRLLCWDGSKTDALKDTVENANFEPHPVSGEVEVGDVDTITYKRFDSETLKAQLPLSDWDLTAFYQWCSGGQEGNAWKLAELTPFNSDLLHDPTWSSSITEANEASKSRIANEVVQAATNNGGRLSVPGHDDDDYWAQYDNSPGRTPARKASVNPPGFGLSEAEYYARYGDVQPAMDNDDPDEQHESVGDSTLKGNTLQNMLSNQFDSQGFERGLPPHLNPTHEEDDVVHVNHPVPSSPSSRGSEAVSRLEETAELYTATEMAVKQHISTTMKSMYRLARGANIPRRDFEDMVQRELEALSIFDRDD